MQQAAYAGGADTADFQPLERIKWQGFAKWYRAIDSCLSQSAAKLCYPLNQDEAFGSSDC